MRKSILKTVLLILTPCLLLLPRGSAIAADTVTRGDASRLQHDAAAMHAVLRRLYDDVPTVADPPETRDLLEHFRLANWGVANSGDLGEYPTGESAARRAAEIRASKATVAIVRGRHFRLDWLPENQRLLDCYRTAATACHAQGLACFAHLDLTLFWQPAFGLLKQNSQWPQRSLRDGTPTRWLCPNHPDLREFYARYVEQVARQGIDGFMLDEISFACRDDAYCGCEHCRAKFEEKTGCRLPEYDDAAVIGNPESPLWRLWQEWQMQSLAEFRLFLLGRLRKINPRIVVLVYSTNIDVPADATNDTFENARVSFAGTEGTDLTCAGYANLYAQHRISLANSRFFGRPAWAQYPVAGDEERIFACLGLAPVTGNGPWSWLDAAQLGAIGQSCYWPHVEELLAPAEPLADLGVLWSSSNRYGPAERGAVECAEASGWLQGLGLRGVQFNPVPAKYARYEHLRPYRAVIVPDAAVLSQETIAAIGRYVEEGGTAVLTGEPGTRDILSFPLGDDALWRRAGLERIEPSGPIGYDRKKATYVGAADHTIRLESGFLPSLARELTIPASYRFNVVLDPARQPKIVARFADGRPAICSLASGKGRYLYLAFLTGKAAFQPRTSQATRPARYHPPQVLDLVRAVALEGTGASDRVVVDGEGILSSAWQRGSRVWVRFVNIAGAQRLPVGKPVGKATPRYPELGLIKVRVRMPLAAEPVLLSPESEKPLALDHVKQGDHDLLAIPAGAFRLSAFLRLEVSP